jgi:hypothetical protein
LILEQVNVSVDIDVAFDVIPLADFEVSFAVINGVDEVVLDVPLVVPLIIDGGVLLLGRITQKGEASGNRAEG